MGRAASGPGYREVADHLRKQISDGVYAPGQQLPALGKLRETYGASLGVMRDALKLLAHERLIEIRAGLGTWVTDPSEWRTPEATHLMQLVEVLRDEVRHLGDRVTVIERRQR